MKKVVLLFAIFLIPLAGWGAQIASITCEDSVTDSIGWLADHTGTPTYVSGYSNKACRSAHNDDDSDADDYRNLTGAGFPATGELYVKMYLKYETDYINTSSNVKWCWLQGSTSGHSEIIYGNDPSPYAGAIPVRWQHSGGTGVGFDAGATTIKYAQVTYAKNDWMLVEVYIKRSTGASYTNSDGVLQLKIDGNSIIYSANAVTGAMDGTIQIPSINGTADQATGHGWWQMDSLEVYDGIPGDADVTAPTITGFTIPSTSASLTVAISSFTATDAVGVAGYCVVETDSSTGCSWSASAPTSYVFGTTGAKTLYAFARDSAGNVSNSSNDAVTITVDSKTMTTGGSQTLTIGGGSQTLTW